jgi:hypothetical protein
MLPVFGGMGVGGNMGSNIGGSMPGSQPHPSSLMPNQFPMPQIRISHSITHFFIKHHSHCY